MIIPEIQQNVISNITDNVNFSIKASAASFQLLSSGLYADKILAVVRELSTNAWDSHIAAGKTDVPFEVKLPTILDNTFYVKDFGVGLSEEQIYSLYTTYFDSTKTSENQTTGCFGLGSKAPFCYSNSFIVESIYDGTLSTYSLYIDENGIPALTKLGSVECTESNGVKVALSVNVRDFSEFERCCVKIYTWFDLKPNVIGAVLSYTTYNYIINTEHAHVRNERNSLIRIIQGNVAYPLDIDQLPAEEHEIRDIIRIPMDVYCDISDPDNIDVAISREQLSYTTRTIKNLVKLLKQVRQELIVEISTKLDECPSLWDAQGLYNKLSKTVSYAYSSNSLMNRVNMWRGIIIPTYHLFPIPQTFSIHFCKQSHSSIKLTLPFIDDKKQMFRLNNDRTVIVFDQYQRTRTELLKAKHILSPHNDHIILLRPIDKKIDCTAEIQSYVDDFGIEVIHLQPRFKTKTVRAPRNTGTYVFNSGSWDKRNIDLSKGGYYIHLDNKQPFHEKVYRHHIPQLLQYATVLNLYDTNKPIIGVSQKQLDKIKNPSDWVNVLDHVIDQLHDHSDIENCINNIAYQESVGGYSILARLISGLNFTDIGTGYMSYFVEKYNARKTTYDILSKSIKLIHCDNINNRLTTAYNLANKDVSEVFDYYPMLQLISWNSYENDTIIKAVQQYIKLIDNSQLV